MMNGYPPYMDITSTGGMVGFDVEIADYISQELGCEVEIKDLGSLNTLFIALEKNTIDCIMSGLDITKKRKAGYEVVFYRGEKINYCYLVSSKACPINELQLKEKKWKIAVEPGSSQESTLLKLQNLEIISLTNNADMMLNLENSKVDGFIVDISQINKFKNIEKNLIYVPIEIPEEYITEGIGILIKKGNHKMVNLIAPVIEKLIKDKIIKQLEQKWGLLEERI